MNQPLALCNLAPAAPKGRSVLRRSGQEAAALLSPAGVRQRIGRDAGMNMIGAVPRRFGSVPPQDGRFHPFSTVGVRGYRRFMGCPRGVALLCRAEVIALAP